MKHPAIGSFAALLLTLLLSALTGCDGKSAPAGGKAARSEVRYPVELQTVTARQVEYTVSAVGSVEAFERVEVTARVPGAIEQVRFAEGDIVSPEQVLVEIEPARYRLSVEAARATRERAEAALAEAKAGLAPREAANQRNPDLVRAEDVDAWRTRVAMAEADLAQARAALALAELNLRDALVRAPVSGVIQTRSAQTGQYVQAGAVLATLLRREPLLLRFQVPEQDAAALHSGITARFRVREAQTPYRATIIHVADAADASSRMVEITARIDDPARAGLRPGVFAEVVVPVGDSATAPVLPQTSIRPSERGFLAFVAEDGLARERILTLGLRTADGLVEVRNGVQPGERLIIRGSEALSDGVKIVEGGGAIVEGPGRGGAGRGNSGESSR